MQRAIRRLRSGERWWAAEAVVRAAGVLLLVLAMFFGRSLEASVLALPAHQTTGLEFGLSCAGVVTGSAGLAGLIEGPGLFRLVPRPRRPLF